MTQQHPITPPPELVEQWIDTWYSTKVKHDELVGFIATQAARWGADQELEACCVLMDEWGLDGKDLMECRRSKPPSLKEQALAALSEADQGLNKSEWQQRSNTIRRALEQLDD